MRSRSVSPSKSLRSAPRSTVAPTPQAEPEPAASDTTRPSRLSFPLKTDGTIDADNLRSSTKESLRRALLDPNLGATLGVQAAQSADDLRLVEKMAGSIYDGLSIAIVAAAQRAGYTPAQAAVAAFTSDDKALLAEPTAKVIDKYFPNFGGKYRDEILLCFAMVNVIGAKIMLLRSGARMLPDGSITIGPSPITPIAPVVNIDQPRSTVAPETTPA